MRVEVKKFAEMMELKLRRHDRKRGPAGWKDEEPLWLLARLKEEVAELEKAVVAGSTGILVRHEAADVGNFAMMITDVYRWDADEQEE